MRIQKFLIPVAAALATIITLTSCESNGTGSTTESGVLAGRILIKGNKPVTGVSITLVPIDHVPSPQFRKVAAGEVLTDNEGRYRI